MWVWVAETERDDAHEGNVAMITLPIPWYRPRKSAGFALPVDAFV